MVYLIRRTARILIVGLACAQLHNGAALGADGDYREEYNLYQQALSAGDSAAAERHAEAAWRAAEDTLGDNALTAVLAFNFGKYVLFTDTDAAFDALKRASELAKTHDAALPMADLTLYLAYCDFKLREERQADADVLFAALKAREAAGGEPDFESASIWLHIALFQLNKKEYELAIYSADRAEQAFVEALPEHYQSQAQAIIIRGAAMLLPRPRSVQMFKDVHAEFVRAQQLFPYQKSIDAFDPVLATAMAWEFAVHGALNSDEPAKVVEEVMEAWTEPDIPIEGFINDDECEGEWSQKGLYYPSKASDWGTIGGVIIAFHLDDKRRPIEPRILAEVPGTLFGKHVLGKVRNWRHAKPLDPRPGCRLNRVHRINFSIR